MLRFKVKAVELIGKIGFDKSEKFRQRKSNFFTNTLWNIQRKFGTEELERVIANIKGITPENVAMDNYITDNGLVRATNIIDLEQFTAKIEVVHLTTLIKNAKKIKRTLA